MTKRDFVRAFMEMLDGIKPKEHPEDSVRSTTREEEKALGLNTFSLVKCSWCRIPSRDRLVRALVETAGMPSIDERTRGMVRRLEPPLAEQHFMAFFLTQLDHDSRRGSNQQMRRILDAEAEALAGNIHQRIEQIEDIVPRTVLVAFFVSSQPRCSSEQDRAAALLRYLGRS